MHIDFFPKETSQKIPPKNPSKKNLPKTFSQKIPSKKFRHKKNPPKIFLPRIPLKIPSKKFSNKSCKKILQKIPENSKKFPQKFQKNNYKYRTQRSKSFSSLFCFDIQNNICTQHVANLYFSGNSMKNILSYCALTDSRMRASEKDLPVQVWS